MGLMTAASKLGLRLAAATANKKISGRGSGLSLFTRRSGTTCAYLGNKPESGSELKSVYLDLCFRERLVKEDTNVVVRRIRFDSYDDHDEEDFLETSIKTMKGIEHVSRCIRFGSQILFAIGPNCGNFDKVFPKNIDPCIDFYKNRYMYTPCYPVKFQVSAPMGTEIKSLATTECKFMKWGNGFSFREWEKWGVIDGKLYCFDTSQSFEVLDPESDDAKWQPLVGHPFAKDLRVAFFKHVFRHQELSVLFLNESKRILGWIDKKRGVFSFDTTKPENGWIELSPSCGDEIPFSGINDKSLFIHDHHPILGDFNLVFVYDGKFLIQPFIIADNFDYFRSIDKPISLPKRLCSQYILPDIMEKYINCSNSDFQFVHLGGKKFGLVLHKFYGIYFDKLGEGEDRLTGIILVLIFKYDVIVSNKDKDLKIRTKLLGKRRFRYFHKNNKDGLKYYHHDLDGLISEMTGAFVF